MSFSARHLFAVLLTIFSLPTLLWAQTAPKDTAKPARGSISGRVTIKEKGVFGVAVALRKAEPSNSNERIPRAMTDQDGFYRILNVAPGTYEVLPSAPAFVPTDVRESRSKTVLLGEEENIENINFTLVRGGVITGRVTDADGRPVIQQQVFIYRAESFDQRRGQQPSQIFSSTGAPTDDRGIYRVFGLMPGRYKVAAGRSEDVFTGSISAGRTSYKQVFHPNETDQTKATVIEVGEGTEAANVDITLGRPLQSFTMTGRVVDGEKGLPVPNVRLVLQRQAGQRLETVSTVSMSNNQGDFFATGLIPGKYSVLLFSEDNSGLRAESTMFDIIDEDVSGVTVKLVQGASLSGVVVFENDNGAALSKFPDLQLRIFVSSTNGASGMSSSATSPIGPNGSFQLTGLPGGLGNMILGTTMSGVPPKGLSIARIERDGTVLGRGVPIQEREQVTGLRVVLNYGTAIIRGVVELQNGTLPEGARIFISLLKQGERGGNMRPPQVDARGRFMIDGIAAGTYEIQATVAGVPQNTYRLAKREISIQDGITTDVTLTIDMNPQQNPQDQ